MGQRIRIRKVIRHDLSSMLKLYLDSMLKLYYHLHDCETKLTMDMVKTWETILGDPNHHIIVCEKDGEPVSSCVCLIVPNLTRDGRPYAVIENVVTHRDHRRRGYASACLRYARELADEAGCYKMMLLTGAKDEGTLEFYRKAGFNSEDKTAFIQWM